jgi:hypothetical protein
MAGNSVLANSADEQVWLRSPWPLLLAICGLGAVWIMAAGSPLEQLEMRWLGQVLRWRYERGLAPPADPSIVHIDITRDALEKLLNRLDHDKLWYPTATERMAACTRKDHAEWAKHCQM